MEAREVNLTEAETKCRVMERNREIDQLNKVIPIVAKMFPVLLPNHVYSTLVDRRWECAKELRQLKEVAN